MKVLINKHLVSQQFTYSKDARKIFHQKGVTNLDKIGLKINSGVENWQICNNSMFEHSRIQVAGALVSMTVYSVY